MADLASFDADIGDLVEVISGPHAGKVGTVCFDGDPVTIALGYRVVEDCGSALVEAVTIVEDHKNVRLKQWAGPDPVSAL